MTLTYAVLVTVWRRRQTTFAARCICEWGNVHFRAAHGGPGERHHCGRQARPPSREDLHSYRWAIRTLLIEKQLGPTSCVLTPPARRGIAIHARK